MRTKIILAVLILLLTAGVGYYIRRDVNDVNKNKIQSLSREGPSFAEMLDRPVNITVDMPLEAQEIAREKIEKLTTELRQNPNLFDNWLSLGIYRKIIGDYEGAAECWKYAATLNPKSPIPYNNLGDLYAYFLKDTKKAEENFLKAIENDPSAVYVYRSLYEFYKYILKDDIKARQILEVSKSIGQILE